MQYHVSFGPNLGIARAIERERTRRGDFVTHYVTLGRLHVIVSRRV